MSGSEQWRVNRRGFLKLSAAAVAASAAGGSGGAQGEGERVVDDFDRPDSFYHGDGWESLNPGYWQIKNGALRRRLRNTGDQNPATWFPWHWETHRNRSIPTERDPSLAMGMIWRRDWRLKGNYTLTAELTIRHPTLAPREAQHAQDDPAYGLMGLCIGGQTLYETREGGGATGDACWFAAYRDDGSFDLYDHSQADLTPVRDGTVRPVPRLPAGARVRLSIEVAGPDRDRATVTAQWVAAEERRSLRLEEVDRRKFTEGYFGLVARGLLDFEVNRVIIEPGDNEAIDVALNECHTCYPLGDTLRQDAQGRWRCRFVAMFRNEGQKAAIRISDRENPPDGWSGVPIAGSAGIQSNDFRINTAIVEATLPADPSQTTLYYTIWKDGRDVTADPRLDAAGGRVPGTGLTEPGPETGRYIGRLPQLVPPYRLIGLGGHAIHRGGPNLPDAGKFQANWVHDQPTPRAYRHQEQFGTQIMAWSDDVWYLELLFPPPSTDDAYKVITLTIAGPTTRWQMMRHWNVINVGDHDYGMDDVKGPEQYQMRRRADLGQDPEYLRRNVKINSHLIAGDEAPSGTENPKRWRRWRMPGGDFSLLVVDPRLWRSSQECAIWGAWGWGESNTVYERTDPTRTLLGEEQFAWLQEALRTDPSPLICIVGINGLHTLFGGRKKDPETGLRFTDRDRVAADYSGWVSAGVGRVMELIGARPGVTSVYGDIHLASIARSVRHGFYECSFGPIGRSGARRLKEDWAPRMTDYNGREVEVKALYHRDYASPALEERTGPKHWNFLEMVFDPSASDPTVELRIRNIIDHPEDEPRGGGAVHDRLSGLGQAAKSRVPAIDLPPQADVQFTRIADNSPILATLTREDGALLQRALTNVDPGTQVLVTARSGNQAEAKVVETEPA